MPITFPPIDRHHPDDTKDGRKPSDAIEAPNGQAPSDKPALEPYWGKPAVRNLRGDDGNVGIIRSPVRAIVLPDQQSVSCEPHSPQRCAPAMLMPLDFLTTWVWNHRRAWSG